MVVTVLVDKTEIRVVEHLIKKYKEIFVKFRKPIHSRNVFLARSSCQFNCRNHVLWIISFSVDLVD